MKDRLDLVHGWVRKAESDLVALDASLGAGAFDAACFHAQQAAEKYVKAFLIYSDLDFPFSHNLFKLTELCRDSDPSFQVLLPVVQPLTPYAVELRYNTSFWPSKEQAERARASALEVRNFVIARLPKEIQSE